MSTIGEPTHTSPETMAVVALAGVTATVVLTLGRLFEGTEFVLPWLVTAGVAHATAATLRTRVASTTARWSLLAGIGTWGSLIVAVPHHLTVGLPTPATWSAVWREVDAAMSIFAAEKAPVEVTAGFVLAGCAAIWVLAIVSDWAAFRARARFEATIPALSAFVFGAVLGTGDRAVTSGVAMLGALIWFAAVSGNSGPDDARWMAHVGRGRAWIGTRTLAITGTALAVAVAAAPLYPSPDDALVSWRADDSDRPPRVTVSPLVDIRGRLVQQSDAEMFRVTSLQPSYWRLTALDRFDGRIWSSLGSYRNESGGLDGTTPDGVAHLDIDQTIEIGALASLWLPAAWEARAIDGIDEVRHDPATGSLITADDTNPGLVYRVTSSRPQLDPATLASVGPAADEPTPGSLALPADFPVEVRRRALEIAGGAGPYEQALRLQAYFRDFTYSLDVAAGHGGNDMVRFLDRRVGYCEQFAGTYAAMARSLGIPARVAVGFTPGEVGDDGRYVVRGEHAHAWPEVWIDGAGWVAFEPTPGRGAPGATGHTGVEPQQAAPGESQGVTPLPDTTTPPPTSPDPTTPTEPSGPEQSPSTSPGPDTGPGDDGTSILPAAATVAAALTAVSLVAAVAVGLAAQQARRRRRRAAAGAAAVDLAWRETLAVFRAAGLPAEASCAPEEHARRLSGRAQVDGPALHRLAATVTTVAYGPDEPDESQLAEVEALAQQVRAGVTAPQGPLTRVWWWVRPPHPD